MKKYMDDVHRVDAGADPEIVERIVQHLGIALQSRDASLVSCSDRKELKRVRESWCERKLGESNARRSNGAIREICSRMRDDNGKNRVTFYYLVARELGQLGAI